MKTTIRPLTPYQEHFVRGLINPTWTSRPNTYTGSGRFSKKSADHAARLRSILMEQGMEPGRHFVTGNDAPRRGWSGHFVTLTPAGRRLKLIRDLIPPPTPAPAPRPEPRPLTPEDHETVRRWVSEGASHPAPPEVYRVKLASGLGWSALERIANSHGQ